MEYSQAHNHELLASKPATGPRHLCAFLLAVAVDDVVRRGRLLSDAIRIEYAAFGGLISTLLERLTPDGVKRVDAFVSEHWGADAPTNIRVDWESLAIDTPAIVQGRTAGICPTETTPAHTNSARSLDEPMRDSATTRR